jgi:hypothetical protein
MFAHFLVILCDYVSLILYRVEWADNLILKNLEGNGRDLIVALSRKCYGGTEQNHENPHSEYQLSRPRFESNTYLKCYHYTKLLGCLMMVET